MFWNMLLNIVVFLALNLLKLTSWMYAVAVKPEVYVEYVQSRNVLVMKDGRPADRDAWLYLPFLRKHSFSFQPPQTPEGRLYRDFLQKGETLEIVSQGRVLKRYTVSSEGYKEVSEEGKTVIRGPLAAA